MRYDRNCPGTGLGGLGLAFAGAALASVCGSGCLFATQGSMEMDRKWDASSSAPSYRSADLRSWHASAGGPRMGLVLVTGQAADQLEMAHDAGPALTTWGWQFELQYGTEGAGLEGIVEIVPLITGMDSELSLLSLNLLMGMRGADGFELCAGPYFSETGRGLTIAVGKTVRSGTMSVPVNLAVTNTKEGARYSLTFGWNLRSF